MSKWITQSVAKTARPNDLQARNMTFISRAVSCGRTLRVPATAVPAKIEIWPNIRVWEGACMQRARGVGASQLNAHALVLELNGFFQHKVQCARTMGRSPIRNVFDVLLYEHNRVQLVRFDLEETAAKRGCCLKRSWLTHPCASGNNLSVNKGPG